MIDSFNFVSLPFFLFLFFKLLFPVAAVLFVTLVLLGVCRSPSLTCSTAAWTASKLTRRAWWRNDCEHQPRHRDGQAHENARRVVSDTTMQALDIKHAPAVCWYHFMGFSFSSSSSPGVIADSTTLTVAPFPSY